MNILEALKELRTGKFIRAADKYNDNDTVYFMVRFMSPFDEEYIKQICLAECKHEDKMPEKMSDLPRTRFNVGDGICLDFIDSENYSVVTKEQLIEEVKKFWIKSNEDAKDQDDDDEEES
jgi:hypothetical protein